MANFNESWPLIKANEGGYNAGGETIAETYMGIDRGANPTWSGWKVIDGLKPLSTKAMNLALGQNKVNLALGQNKDIQANVISFFLNNYWNSIKLSQITDQQVANNLMDTSVNMGTGIAGKFLQMACNASLVEVGNKSLPLIVDGVVGFKTIQLANEIPGESIYNHINLLREARYRDIVVNSPKMKPWLPVWLNRLTKYKH